MLVVAISVSQQGRMEQAMAMGEYIIETNAEEQRNTDERSKAATRQALQQVREEIEGKMQHMVRQLKEVLLQTNRSDREQRGMLARAEADKEENFKRH